MTEDWTKAETEVLARSLMSAPSVHNLQPWLLDVGPDELLVRERTELRLPHHDPLGRDRATSCGAAVANLELAVRTLGRAADVEFLPYPARPDVVARIAAEATSPPTGAELHLYGAIARRASHRAPFEDAPVPAAALRRIGETASAPGVEARMVGSGREVAQVARLLRFAAEQYQSDGGYQRELSLWTIRDEQSHRYGVGLPASRVPAGAVPWAGLVRSATDLPELADVEAQLATESLFVFVTADDTRLDHIRAGYAMERAWLTAVDVGLSAAVLTQPLHLEPARCALCVDLTLSGFPQVLMRVGYSTDVDPAGPRRAVEEVLRRH